MIEDLFLERIRQHKVVLGDPGKVSTKEMVLEGLDVSEGPEFNVTEVAKVFFGRSPYWIRNLDREGKFILNGEYVGGYRTASDARRYDLSHVEKMAHALAEHGVIDGIQLRDALIVVRYIAKIWGYISE